MYIVKKEIPGRRPAQFYSYYYLVKSEREEDKVIQKHVAYLGKDKTIAMEKVRKKNIDLEEIRKVKGLTIIKENESRETVMNHNGKKSF